jgi:uncharacterized protein YdhG (YjbR/CyaY superfamily)
MKRPGLGPPLHRQDVRQTGRAMAAKSKSNAKPKTIDEYLATVSDDKRAALERLREIIRAAAPGAEECISYQLPAFRLEGKGLLYFGASANHCALYGVPDGIEDELESYDTSGRGTIRFEVDKPLPATLVRKLVKARIAEITAQQRPAKDGAARRR